MKESRIKVAVWVITSAVVIGLLVLAGSVVMVVEAQQRQAGLQTSAVETGGPLTPGAEPRDRCNPNQGPSTSMTDPVAGGALGSSSFADMRDLGPREFADGDVTFNTAGLPATYTVAAGDAPDAIVARFCLTQEELHILNFVRFCIDHTIQPGDIYNLDPSTVESVGGAVSGVCNNKPTFDVP